MFSGERRAHMSFFTRISLQKRLWMLFAVSALIPFLFVWLISADRIGRLNHDHVDTVIRHEITMLESNISLYMDNLKHVSQQVISGDTMNMLREYLDTGELAKVRRFLNAQVALYEASNPNINNIAFMCLDERGTLYKLNDAIIVPKLPGETLELSVQNVLTYYGPHTTYSMAGRYSVISLVRRIILDGYPPVYLYIESGYKKLEHFGGETLDALGSIYLTVSDSGNVSYSSDASVFSAPIAPAENAVGGDGIRYLARHSGREAGWSVLVLMPDTNYRGYLNDMMFSFLYVAAGVIVLSLVLTSIIWNSVRRPIQKFSQNLKILSRSDAPVDIKEIHVEEFDKYFSDFANLKIGVSELVKSVQDKEEERLQLEINQILGKINPHFLHNTLNTLKNHLADQRDAEGEHFVSSLNRLLIYNMEKEKRTTLENELNAVDNYIELQKLKYDINYHREISLPGEMLQTEIARFILQPLVENAIYHGLEGKGSIWISVDLTPAGMIRIRIINDGYPMDEEKVNAILSLKNEKQRNGIGIQYVLRMLQLIFADAFSFDIYTKDGLNTTEIQVPYNRGDFYAESIDH